MLCSTWSAQKPSKTVFRNWHGISALPNAAGLRRTFRFDRAGADATWSYVVAGRPALTLTKDATGALLLDVPFTSATP